MIGKIGNVIAQNPLSSQETKNLLNSIISSASDGIEELEFEEKEELAKRIQKDGKKIEEDAIETEETPLEGEANAEELYEEDMATTSFDAFCQDNGYSTQNDDEVVKAIISYATKHDSGEIEADFESVASEVNPYIFDKISEMVSDEFKTELEGALDPTQIHLGSSETQLFEGYEHLGKVIEKLVYTIVK